MATATEDKTFSNISATSAAFPLRGGKYAVAASATGTGSMGLSMVSLDGSTQIPTHTAFASTTGYAVVDLAPANYVFSIATFTAVFAAICRVPS